MSEKYEEGQKVLIFNVNRRGGREGLPGTVVKVGRTLFHVMRDDDRSGTLEAFRIETGQANDNHGHTFVRTPEQVEEAERRTQAIMEIRDAGLDFQHGKAAGYSTGELEDISHRLRSFGRV